MNIYRLRDTGYSSRRFGACHVCRQHADSVHMLVTWAVYQKPDGREGVTARGVDRPLLLGHRDCLAAQTGL